MPFVLSQEQARALDVILPFALAAAALKLSDDAYLHFQCVLEIFIVIFGSIVLIATFSDVVVTPVARPVHPPELTIDRQKRPEEMWWTGVTVFVFAQLAAWPLQLMRQGKQTAFCSFEESLPFASSSPEVPRAVCYIALAAKLLLLIIFADTFTFWKHYSLHSQALGAIHAVHHRFREPTTFAAFALSSVEAAYTFCPVVLFCLPGLRIHALTYLPILASMGLLNIYLHCNFVLAPLERVLPLFYVSTSAFHAQHHYFVGKANSHYGELLTAWDYLLGTDRLRQENYLELFETLPLGSQRPQKAPKLVSPANSEQT